MKIVPIFVSETRDDGLWSIRFENDCESEFEKFFKNVNAPEFLFHFFDAIKKDLESGFWGPVNIERAVLYTMDEAREMEDALYEYTGNGLRLADVGLQQLFKPLNNYEYAIVGLQKSKARIKRGWLRLYGIRLAANCYLITGGAIKLTKDMNAPHLLLELKKLEQTKNFLQMNGIYFPEDLNINHE